MKGAVSGVGAIVEKGAQKVEEIMARDDPIVDEADSQRHNPEQWKKVRAMEAERGRQELSQSKYAEVAKEEKTGPAHEEPGLKVSVNSTSSRFRKLNLKQGKVLSVCLPFCRIDCSGHQRENCTYREGGAAKDIRREVLDGTEIDCSFSKGLCACH